MNGNSSIMSKLGRNYARGKPLPVEMRNQVIQMLEEGKTPAEISAELKIAAVTVNRWQMRYQMSGSVMSGCRFPQTLNQSIKEENDSEANGEVNSDFSSSNNGQMDDSQVNGEYEGTSNGLSKHTENGSHGSQSSSTVSTRNASNRHNHLNRIQFKRVSNKKTIQRLKKKAALTASRRKQSTRLANTEQNKNMQLKKENGQFLSNTTSNMNGHASHNGTTHRSLRSLDLPKVNLSPEAHSEVQLRESPLSPPPPTIPSRMRRLDVPISDHHYPITLVINPPAIVMGQQTVTNGVIDPASASSSASAPTTSAATTSGAVGYPTTPFPSKVIIEIRYA